jgi:hypothetical protein
MEEGERDEMTESERRETERKVSGDGVMHAAMVGGVGDDALLFGRRPYALSPLSIYHGLPALGPD